MASATFRTIILAYDGSEGSLNALEHAKTLARRFEAAIVIVTAFPQFPRLAAPSKEDVEGIHEARALAEDLAAALGREGFRAESDVLEGPAADAIINAADAREADLIVMGSRGHGQFTGLLLGSVSDRVVHYAKTPVLIVR